MKRPRWKYIIPITALAVLLALALAAPWAMYRVGNMRLGEPRNWNPDGAAVWYELAARLGYCEKPDELGEIYSSPSDTGKYANYPLAVRFFKIAAGRGDREAMAWLGEVYGRGEIAWDYCDVKQDLEQSWKWTRKAAEAGEVDSIVDLADQCRDEHDLAGAARWYRKAAESDDEELKKEVRSVYYELGQIYEKGLGVTPDNLEAAKWYRKAVENGDTIRAANDLERLEAAVTTSPGQAGTQPAQPVAQPPSAGE